MHLLRTATALTTLAAAVTAFAEPAATQLRPPPTAHPPLDPPPFWWGTATAAYQVEGAVTAHGRGPSIWDAFSHTPGKTAHGDTGDDADEFYSRFSADLLTAAALGTRAFRFSLAWPRLFPNGTGRAPHPEGVAFYHRVLDACEGAGLEPWVTLFHWDLPLALQAAYGGWASPAVVPDFAAYAAAAFSAFGGRVKSWTTLNEPWSFCMQGYGSGVHAPGVRGKAWECVRHALLAHAAAAAAFKATPGLVAGGARLSLNLNANWAEPWDPANPADVAAAARALDYDLGAFAGPLHTGAWPESLAERSPRGLVPFTAAEAAALTASRPDFFALNYYTAAWIKASPGAVGEQGQGVVDLVRIQDDSTPGGRGPIGPRAESPWLFSVPWGLRKMLRHVRETYIPASIAITENGCDAPGEDAAPWPASLNDTARVEYFRAHVAAAEAAVLEDGIPLEGYFAWSLLDNYEWSDGYAKRFGLLHVDYSTQARSVKASAVWLARRFRGTGGGGGEGRRRGGAVVGVS